MATSPTIRTSNALVLDVGIDPCLGQSYCDRITDEVAEVLRELVKERPEMASLLRDRTFARTLQ
jgi:hypothetical protein